jgi:hypothetical protein
VRPIAPHLLNYLLWFAKDHEELLECQFCTLSALHQILLNPFLDPDQYLHIIMTLIMSILLCAGSRNDDIQTIVQIKVYAARILALACKR